MPPRRQRRPAPDLETNSPPDETRRYGQRPTPPDSSDNAGPSDYEREIDRLDAAAVRAER